MLYTLFKNQMSSFNATFKAGILCVFRMDFLLTLNFDNMFCKYNGIFNRQGIRNIRELSLVLHEYFVVYRSFSSAGIKVKTFLNGLIY